MAAVFFLVLVQDKNKRGRESRKMIKLNEDIFQMLKIWFSI